MSKTLKILLGVLTVLVLLGAGGLFYYSYYLNKKSEQNTTTTAPKSNYNPDTSKSKTEATIKKAQPDTTKPMPKIEGSLPAGSVVVPAP